MQECDHYLFSSYLLSIQQIGISFCAIYLRWLSLKIGVLMWLLVNKDRHIFSGLRACLSNWEQCKDCEKIPREPILVKPAC